MKCTGEVAEEKISVVKKITGYKTEMVPYEAIEMVPETKLVEVTNFKTEIVQVPITNPAKINYTDAPSTNPVIRFTTA